MKHSIRRPLRLALLALTLTACRGAGDSVAEAGLDPDSMDTSVDPCSDFFQYACGGFVTSHPVGDDGATISRRASAFYATEDVEQSIVEEASSQPQGADEVVLGAYFTACQGAAGGQPHPELDALLAQIDAVAGPDDVAAAVAAVHAAGGSALFYFGSTRNIVSPGPRVPYVGQGGLGLPDASYYLSTTTMDVITPYRAHIVALSGILGVSDPFMANAVVKIETALAQATVPDDQLRDPSSDFHVTDRATFEASAPHFSWAAYRAAVGAPAYDALDVDVPAFFVGLEAALGSASLTDLQSYLRWRAIEAFAGALDDQAVAEEYAFHDGVFYGFSTPLPRDEYCLRYTGSELPWSMSRAYVGRAFTSDQGAAARAILDDVRAALKEDLSTASFLDAPTRKAALAKLDALHVAVGAPTTWPGVSGLSVDSSSFASASAAVTSFFFRTDVATIGTTPADDGWFMPPNEVNAAYEPESNAIDFPAAILQAPLFDESYAKAVSYGSIGAIMGHEMTHGYDDDGRHFDGAGKLTDWWTAATATAFQARTQCLVDEYDGIEATPGVNVDGELSLGENIADLGGVRLAYAALAPSGDDARAFFLAYAQSWCENDTEAFLATLARTDPHAPPRARVNAVLANVGEFADAFSCPAGSPMVSAKPCAVW